MRSRSYQRSRRLWPMFVLVVLATVGAVAQEGQMVEWRTYGADLANTRYLPLDQINADNFSDLEVAWRLPTRSFGPRPEYAFQSTPLMVGGGDLHHGRIPARRHRRQRDNG